MRRRYPICVFLAVAGFVALSSGVFLMRRAKEAAFTKQGIVATQRFGGSESCRECHQQQFEDWHQSHHAKAERGVADALDRDAFQPTRFIVTGDQTNRVQRNGDRLELVGPGENGRLVTNELTRVIGVAPLRQYLAPANGGRLQVTELAFDPAQHDWFNVFGDENRKRGEWGHWTGRGMTWNSMCASCHNTGVEKNYDFATDHYATRIAEMSVSCESCHGPMKDHVDWQRSAQPALRKDPTLKKLTAKQTIDTCGSCHARRGDLTGKFQPGELFDDHFQLSIPDHTDVFYPDGQVRDEDFEFTSFHGSKMHAAGVSCTDCHNPHTGKAKLPGNALCMQCHSGKPGVPMIDPDKHTFHAAGPGSSCVDCHMPLTTYMQRHPRRDHGFTIPDPLLTKLHGIPNACNRCHTAQSIDWAIAHVEQWYGDRMNRPTRRRALLLAEARSRDTNAVLPLVNLLREEPSPLWRASIVTILGSFIGESEVVQAILSRTMDTNALVRSAAAKVLSPLAEQRFAPAATALRSLLDDPSRSVRVDAAWALRNELNTNSTAGTDLMKYLSYNADQPVGALQFGHYLLARNEMQNALSYFERAVQWDKNSAPLRHDYAVALNLAGKNGEAIAQLREAIRTAPGEAEYHYKLALALHEAGELREATRALERSVQLNPEFSRAWYNLGLAHAAVDDLRRAFSALERAEQLDRRSAEIPYAKATVLERMNLLEAARDAAQNALERNPQFAPAARFLSK